MTRTRAECGIGATSLHQDFQRYTKDAWINKKAMSIISSEPTNAAFTHLSS